MACFLSVAVAKPQQSARNFIDFENEVQQFSLDVNFKETTTPIPILRHLDTQNPDGSYTYGYESGEGAIFVSFPTHHTKFIAKQEKREKTYIENCFFVHENKIKDDDILKELIYKIMH